MSASQRRKGASGEREVCAILSEHGGHKITRKLSQTRDGGHDISYQDLRIEVKRRAGIAPLRWYEQACVGAKPHETPVVVMREDGNPEWFVMLPLRTFLSMGPQPAPATVEEPVP